VEPEVAILGADQKERDLWGRECYSVVLAKNKQTNKQSNKQTKQNKKNTSNNNSTFTKHQVKNMSGINS